jgi:MYXO-CTERM domain-containing protein
VDATTGGQYQCSGSTGSCFTSCTSDSQCDNTLPCNNFCDLVTTSSSYQRCVARAADGKACDSDDACLNGHCVAGICCNSTCTSTNANCAGSCTSGTCTYPSANACSCTVGSTSATQLTCDGNGNCPASSATTCGNTTNLYTCASSTTCNTGCSYKPDGSGDVACFPGYYCNTGNVCVLKLPAGSTCSLGDQCGTGFCYGNACCAGACETTTSCTGANCMCASTGCNVTGSCGYPSGTTCQSQTCSAGVETFASTCDGNGTCKAPSPATQSCGLYNCNGSACLTACTQASDCSTNFCCLVGTLGQQGCTTGLENQCLGKLPDGQSCGQNSDCMSNACSQGVCCNRSCAGGCTEACNLPGANKGTCTAIANSTDPLGICNQGDSTCAGTCQSGACSYPGTSTKCGSGACAACNGGGTCTGTMPGCFADAGVPDAMIAPPDMGVTSGDSAVTVDSGTAPHEAGPPNPDGMTSADSTTSADANTSADAHAGQPEASTTADSRIRPDIALHDGGSVFNSDSGFSKGPGGTPPAGCGCTVGGANQNPVGALLVLAGLLGLALVAVRRRRA